jgi:7,8-dihydropterin-6-yl-methyl-4-(beta-D-ribofuranosyl)aminobenzene 5'-phosphate synthase
VAAFSLRNLTALFGLLAFIPAYAPAGPAEQYAYTQIKLKILFNNVARNPDFRLGWGFSCLIQGLEQNILFDTGSNGESLQYNLKLMGLRAEDVQAVVLSHAHFDHTGGLDSLLHVHPKVTIYAPSDLAAGLQTQYTNPTRVVAVSEPGRLFSQVYSTGSMGNWMQEQALIIDLPAGLVILTGCAHPGITNIVRKAKDVLHREVLLLLGGFHLMNHTQDQIADIARQLDVLGVAYISPSHCTGDAAMQYFRRVWGQRFIDGGCGARIVVNEQVTAYE